MFFGTPEIAVPSLRALHDLTEVVLVVSQPDRPAGRGRRTVPTPVKAAALEMGIEVFQPERLRARSVVERLHGCGADLFLVTAYGRILPGEILDIPGRGCLNVHASLLPRHRGAAPIQRAILEGDTETGLTLMLMDRGLDTGPIIAAMAVPIGPTDTAGDLARRLGEAAPGFLSEVLPRWIAGRIEPIAQDGSRATLAPPLTKREGIVDFGMTTAEVSRRIRAVTPWPGARARLGEVPIKLLAVGDALPPDTCPCTVPGGVAVLGGRLLVRCKDGWLEVLRLQATGRKPLDAAAFVCGRQECDGAVLECPGEEAKA